MRLGITCLIVLCTAVGTATAMSAASRATISPRARLHPNLSVAGTARCAAGDRLTIRLWLIQASSGAFAKGSFPPRAKKGTAAAKADRALGTCKNTSLKWSMAAVRKGKKAFKAGPGLACAVVLIKSKTGYSSATSTCAHVTLA